MPKIMKNGTTYGSSPAKLNEISDVNITSPQANQVIARNSANNAWINTGAEDVKSQITWNESTASGAGAWRVANMLFITYQGGTGTHSAGDTLFTLPSGLRPIQNWQAPFVVNAVTYGNVSIGAGSGNCNINQINDNTQGGRIYFTVAFPIS